ncbi:MAG: hypothetical protein Q9223_001094 [Gallowayella weberi]
MSTSSDNVAGWGEEGDVTLIASKATHSMSTSSDNIAGLCEEDDSSKNVVGWYEDDDERLIACAYHIRSADAWNIAKYISVFRDRRVVDGDIKLQFGYIHARYNKWNETEASRSATGSVKEPPTYNVVHFWAVLWSDEEERRSPEHEKRITVYKREYDWAMDNWSEFQRI